MGSNSKRISSVLSDAGNHVFQFCLHILTAEATVNCKQRKEENIMHVRPFPDKSHPDKVLGTRDEDGRSIATLKNI